MGVNQNKTSKDWRDYWANESGGWGSAANLRAADYSYNQVASYMNWHLGFKKEDFVLDVGCGNGLMMQEIVGWVDKVYGVDISTRLLEAGQENLEKYGDKCIFEKPVDVFLDKLPFPDNFFDKVYCLGLFQYADNVSEGKGCLKEMYRVCKHGGKMLIGDVINASYLPSQPGMFSFEGMDLAMGYDFEQLMSNYEPYRRFDLFINKP